MKKGRATIVASDKLIDRKAHARFAHLWFGRDPQDYKWMEAGAPLPEGRAIIRGAFVDPEGSAKLLLESEDGELREFYAEHVTLDPEEKDAGR